MLERLRGRNRIQRETSPNRPERATQTHRASGLRFWLSPAAVLIAALIVTPILWIGLARWAGIPLGTVSDLGGLLATIGGAMGAIFALGGLVIALVSVYS